MQLAHDVLAGAEPIGHGPVQLGRHVVSYYASGFWDGVWPACSPKRGHAPALLLLVSGVQVAVFASASRRW
jgi:hypothetical protein